MWRPVIQGNLFPNTNVKSVVQKVSSGCTACIWFVISISNEGSGVKRILKPP